MARELNTVFARRVERSCWSLPDESGVLEGSVNQRPGYQTRR